MSLISTYKQLEEYVNTPTIYDINPYLEIVNKINILYHEMEFYTDFQLKAIHNTLKYNISKSDADHQEITEAFALIKVLVERHLGLVAYDVQLIAGLVIYEGRIAEMQTGEGKTIAALFPTYLRSLEGKGIHIHSFNDYLSNRDHEYFSPIFDFLELNTACIQEGMEYHQLEEALNRDITYGSSKQFLYTYLKQSVADICFEDLAHKYHYAIIDEADAILLDEATNPFVIAGNSKDFNVDFHQISKTVHLLVKAQLFEYTDFRRGVFLTDKGIQFVEEALGVSNLFHDDNMNLLSAVNLSLHAHVLLKKDEDYIVYNKEVLLVDEFTGRVVMDRKWRNGLQTAVEAKEGLEIKSEGCILNCISIPNFYAEYNHVGAMTATARESASELEESYGLVLVVIPPNIPSQRIDYATRVFRSRSLKNEAVIQEILEVHQTGRPILIGTQHISETEGIYSKMMELGVKCEILNAKNDDREADIVSRAGMLNAITISTNMAGRGTDIKLGGELGIDRDRIEKLGGLLVIGTNMHRSGRIDRQLRGRAGRQGEAGASQFFVSLEDEIFDKNKMRKILPKKFHNITVDEIIDDSIHKYLLHAQEVSEDQDNLIRSSINKYAEISHYQSQLIRQWKEKIQRDPEKDLALKKAIIFEIDQRWANYISNLLEVKDGVHFISIAGQNPLRAYRILADRLFVDLQDDLKRVIQDIEKAYHRDKGEFYKISRKKGPSSSCTYTLSENGFTSNVESLMKNQSNIAFQVDFLGLTALAIKYGWQKLKLLFTSKNQDQWK